ncbi:MAG: ABC transporter permease [Clostridia bacterium]|nr:ABC transporter permease [Clostridia bacterium]
MFSIFKREFKSYFTSVTGCIFIAFLLCFTGIYVTSINLRGGYASFEYVLSNIIIVFLLIVPLLTMRSFAEEKHTKTDQLLYSLPMSVTEVVLGKYLAMLAVFAIPVLIMAVYPVILSAFGYMAYKSAYLALFAFFILGAALIALGMFMSSLTESQVIAAVISFGALLLMYMMNGVASLIPASAVASLLCFCVLALLVGLILYSFTKNYAVSIGVFCLLVAGLIVFYLIDSSSFAGLFGSLLTYLAVFDRFTELTGGIFDVTAIVYLITFAVFFIYLTVQSVEKRRWS